MVMLGDVVVCNDDGDGKQRRTDTVPRLVWKYLQNLLSCRIFRMQTSPFEEPALSI